MANDLSVMAIRGDVNKDGTTDEMEWAAMELEEVQDQLNDSDEIYHTPVDIISYHWRPSDGMLMLKTTKIYSLDKDTHDADKFRVDYSGYLALYILKSTIGLKRSRNTHIFQKAK